MTSCVPAASSPLCPAPIGGPRRMAMFARGAGARAALTLAALSLTLLPALLAAAAPLYAPSGAALPAPGGRQLYLLVSNPLAPAAALAAALAPGSALLAIGPAAHWARPAGQPWIALVLAPPMLPGSSPAPYLALRLPWSARLAGTCSPAPRLITAPPGAAPRRA